MRVTRIRPLDRRRRCATENITPGSAAPRWRPVGSRRGVAACVAVLTVLLVVADAAPAFAANDIPTVITNTRNWIVGILAGLATLFLTIGGLRYVMAGGDPGEIEKAKAALRAAAIGYALAILAPVLLEILQGIVGTDPAQNPAPPPQAARDA